MRLVCPGRSRSASARGPMRSRITIPVCHPPSGFDRIGSGAARRSIPRSIDRSLHPGSNLCRRAPAESPCIARESARAESEAPIDNSWFEWYAAASNTGASFVWSEEMRFDGIFAPKTWGLCSIWNCLISGLFGPRKCPQWPSGPTRASLCVASKISVEHSCKTSWSVRSLPIIDGGGLSRLAFKLDFLKRERHFL